MQSTSNPGKIGTVLRGFTTLQLLELAALSTVNALHANGVSAQKYGVPSRSPVVDQLMQGIPDLQLPIKSHNLIPTLSGNSSENYGGWFNNSKVINAYRAKTPEGEAIERLRPQIINYLGEVIMYLEPRYWPERRLDAKTVYAPTGTALDQVLLTSWQWGRQASRTLKTRYEAVLEVLQATTNEEPADTPIHIARVAENQMQSVNVNTLSPRGSTIATLPSMAGVALTPAALPAAQNLSPRRSTEIQNENAEEIVTPYTVRIGFQDGVPVVLEIRLGMASDSTWERMVFVRGGPQRSGREAWLAINTPVSNLYEYGRLYRDEQGMLEEFRDPVFGVRHPTPISLYAETHTEEQFKAALRNGYDPEGRLLVLRVTLP